MYLSRRDPLPALGYARVDLLSSTLRPGSTPEKAIAIVIQLDEEGLGTARNPLPIARRCKKGMEEMVRAIKTFMDATVHKKVILGARIRKLKEPETRAEGKRTAQGEETSEREPAKYEQAPRSEQREQEKELPRVSELEDATERREMQEREVVADTHAAEATRGHTPSRQPSAISSPVVPKSYQLPRPPTYPPRLMIQRPRTSVAASGSVTSRGARRRHTTANARPQGIRRSMIMMMPYLVHSSRG